MEELRKIYRILEKEYPEAYLESLVVLDGTTGQNALAQACLLYTSTQEAEKEVEPEVPVAKPELVTNLSGSVTYKTGDEAAPLAVEVTTSYEGEITYQWYQSLTNTNGGGTIIEGATESSYTPVSYTHLYYTVWD